MNAPNQPDIEIYIKDAGPDDIRAWLAKRLGPLTAEPARGAMAKFTIQVDDVIIPVRIISGAVGKSWSSVWLDSPDTPWADDLACGRDCFAVLGKEVRCATGGWSEADNHNDPDAFVRITADGESAISWKTG